MNAKDLRKSLILTVVITCVALGFWLGFAKITIGAYNETNLTKQFMKEDSKVFKTFVIEVGTDTIARIVVGTSSMTLTGTSSYSTQPRIEFDGATGLWSFKNAGGGTQTTAFGTLTPSYLDANFINKTGGAGSNTTLESSTFTGAGTASGTLALTGTISAGGANISKEELSYSDGLTGNINTFQTTHQHGGTDSTRVSHDNVAGTGTNSHATIDSHIADTSDPHGATLTQTSAIITNGTITNGYINTLTVQSSVIGLEDADIPPDITLTNLTQITSRNYDDLSGTSTIKPTQVAIGTTTLQGALNVVGTGTFSGTVTVGGLSGDASGATNISNLRDRTVLFVNPMDGHQLQFSGGNIINAPTSASVAWSGITGNPLDAGSITATGGANKITMTDSNGKFNFGTNTYTIIQFVGTTTAITNTSSNGRFINFETFTAPPNDNSKTYLLHFDGAASTTVFTDSGASNRTFTAFGTADIATTPAVFGQSGRFSTSTAYITTPDQDDQDFGTGDFTIGGRAYRTKAISIASHLCDKNGDSPQYGWYCEYSTTAFNFGYGTNGTSQSILSWTYTPPIGSWYSWEVDRGSSSVYFFINGNQVGAAQNIGTGTDLFNSTNVLTVGSNGWSADGYFDEFYIVKGTALHTGTYTVETQAFAGSGYNYNVLQYIPPGTTTAYLSIIDDGTNTNKIKVVIGGTEYSTTTTGYRLDVANGSILAKSFVTTPSSSEVKTDLPGIPEQEALQILDNSEVHKFYYKDKEVPLAEAEKVAKERYVIENIETDYALWQEIHQNEYIIGVTGTGSVSDTKKMWRDFEKQNRTNKEVEFNTLSIKSELIQMAKANLEKSSDKRNNSPNYGIEIDSGCPVEVLNLDRLPTLEKWVGFNYAVGKGLLEELKALKTRVETLEAKP